MLNALAGLLVLIMMLPGLAALWDMGVVSQQQRVAAEHLQAVTRASAHYVRKHQTSLLAAATPSSGPVIGVSDLVADRLLPAGFQGRNLWGQGYQIYLRQPEPNALQAIVLTTGGRAVTASFANITIPGAAALAGGVGGYIPSGTVAGQSSGQLLGAGGGWVVPLASMGITSPGAGHLGALSAFDTSALGQDYLYRVAVPGNPELNAMRTELNMTGHAVRGVSELQFTQREITSESCAAPEEQGRVFLDARQGLYLCRDNALEVIGDTGNAALLKETRLARNGEMVTKPICPPGTGTVPMIFTSPTIVEAGPDAPPIHALQAWATSANDTQWQVHLRLLTSDTSLSADGSGWVYPEELFGRVMTLTTCAREVVTP